VWQMSLDYLDLMYEVAAGLPTQERYNLAQQMRRAATSVSLNIAEGSTGQTDAEQNRFLGFSLRSVVETVACLRIVQRRHYPVDPETLSQVGELGELLAKLLQSMRRSLIRHQP